MAKRAKGFSYPSKKASSAKNDNTRVLSGGKSSVRTLSSEDHKNVGRPGFGTTVPGPVDGKSSVTRVMKRDPAKGTSQPSADRITSTHVDLVGNQNPTIVSKSLTAPSNAGKKVVRTPRKSLPVYSNKPGRVSRGPR